ncbi:hypothetical protein [Clostridium saccharobutylicum]|uniref:Uncharacterized protein n=1 Tax=Clostridium saccharobutylicum DSM 13864 TaxID=1345695 RepID=U5MPP4_CLOSA|nr:hypothetical protein [Clostridium saccharobutylicum]AGX41372.1 hypothetical protein CLSA_c03200 [Clostridium saccharobutylicum DSM 13864]AQR88653.1 hypothetical protein CLOSC_03150 [Clostridium saccharobutylicum]AQR98551.1 hypothetical protein CSACC_03150 [Clostridium saccharobutylicum]AQS12541.1 hypothetical protein CLOSACC_03150 [Clostridium saccharobutylicum]MBA2905560.1 hypothetical protein [Clostridium saccharobutylicum]
MIKIKLEKNKSGKIIFKLKVAEIDRNNILLKRALMEGKVIKGNTRFNYEVPLRFFIPICNNVDKTKFNLDNKSLLSYLEFSDYYDENYYTEIEATPKYMKKWREEGCPDIYRITIDKETYDIKKEVAFKKPTISFGKFKL